jgi:hypothetical protein
VEQAAHVKEVLECYERGTGQLVNPAKCSIMFNPKGNAAEQEEVANNLQVQVTAFEARYLGLPTARGRQKRSKFQSIKERMSKRLMDYSEKCMSSGPKEVLIKSVAQALPTYIMSVFQLPLTLCDELTGMIRELWWGTEKGKKKMAWLAWDKLTLKKCGGGLGFKDFRLFNQALLARQAWSLLEYPDSLCARMLKAKYYPRGHLLDTAFASNPSQTWQAILHGLELLKKRSHLACWRWEANSHLERSLDPERVFTPCHNPAREK